MPPQSMAIAFVRANTVSRSKGGSAGAALAYEACTQLEGIGGACYDFRNKSSLETPTRIVGMDCDLQELADKMELSEKRKNSTVARRYIVALPHEISKEERAELALGFLEHLHQEYGVAGAVTVHEPDRGGDGRNYHAHITISDREVNEQGEFGKKVRILTDMKTRNVELEKIKENWNAQCNLALEKEGHAPVKEKSAVPGVHLGKEATEMIRKKKGYKIETVEWNEACKTLSEEQESLDRSKETREEKIKRLVGDDEPENGKEPIRDLHAEYLEQEEQERREYDRKGTTRDSEADRTSTESEAHQTSMGGLKGDYIFPRQGSGRDEEEPKRCGEPSHSKRPTKTSRGEASRSGSRKLESLLREVKRRARKLDQRKDATQRERQARSHQNFGSNSNAIGESRVWDSMEENKRKVLDAFKSIMPKNLKHKLNSEHLKDLFTDYKKTINKVVEKALSQQRSRGHEDEGR